jgi:hypothetical protein
MHYQYCYATACVMEWLLGVKRTLYSTHSAKNLTCQRHSLDMVVGNHVGRPIEVLNIYHTIRITSRRVLSTPNSV